MADIEKTKSLMGALVRMKPKPHAEIKTKARPAKTKPAAKKRVSAKRGNA